MRKFFRKVGVFTEDELVGTWRGFSKEKISPLILLLVVLNVVCLLVSNIVAVKTFDVFSLGPIQVSLPAAVILFPLVLIISDMLAEINYIWTRRSCHIGFIMNLLMAAVFAICISINGKVGAGADQGPESLMGKVLGSSWFMLLASMTSFYFGDLVNDLVFKRMKAKNNRGNGSLFGRCVLSTLLGQLIDSSIFITLGMKVLPEAFLGYAFIGGDGPWHGWAAVFCAIITQVLVKTLYEIIMSPAIISLCKKAVTFEQTRQAEALTN